MKRKNQSQVKNKKISDSDLCKAAKQKANVKDARIIPPGDVETAPWVRLKCQFGCDGYGSCLVCPPYSPTPQQMREVLDSYNRALLVHFAPEGGVKATIFDLEQEFFFAGAWKALGLGAGSCSLCKECNLKQQQCRHAYQARPSMEACGIDVFSTVKKVDFPIEVVRTRRQCPNFYGLILID